MRVSVPTFVLDYPEATRAMAYLTERFGVKPAATFPGYGHLPDTAKCDPRPLPAEPFIIVNGSGDYHHETVTFIDGFLKARGEEQKFVYIQIDAHPDKDDTFRWKLDCASFVGLVMEHDNIERVYLLGIYPECLDTNDVGHVLMKKLRYYNCDYFQKLHQYIVQPSPVFERMFDFLPGTVEDAAKNPAVLSHRVVELEHPNKSHLPAVLQDGPEPALEVNWKALDEMDWGGIPDLPVYLTIDLDVARDRIVTDWRRDLEEHEPITPWGYGDNQGNMPFDDLLKLVRRLGSHCRIAGADFCGFTRHFEELSEEALESSLSAVGDIYEALVDAIERD